MSMSTVLRLCTRAPRTLSFPGATTGTMGTEQVYEGPQTLAPHKRSGTAIRSLEAHQNKDYERRERTDTDDRSSSMHRNGRGARVADPERQERRDESQRLSDELH